MMQHTVLQYVKYNPIIDIGPSVSRFSGAAHIGEPSADSASSREYDRRGSCAIVSAIVSSLKKEDDWHHSTGSKRLLRDLNRQHG